MSDTEAVPSQAHFEAHQMHSLPKQSKLVKIPRVFGVGIDIQRVKRMERFLQGGYKERRFLTGVYHPIEIEEFYKRDEGAPRL